MRLPFARSVALNVEATPRRSKNGGTDALHSPKSRENFEPEALWRMDLSRNPVREVRMRRGAKVNITSARCGSFCRRLHSAWDDLLGMSCKLWLHCRPSYDNPYGRGHRLEHLLAVQHWPEINMWNSQSGNGGKVRPINRLLRCMSGKFASR